MYIYIHIYIYIYIYILYIYIFQINHKSCFTPIKDDHEQTIQVSSISVNIYVRQNQRQLKS